MEPPASGDCLSSSQREDDVRGSGSWGEAVGVCRLVDRLQMERVLASLSVHLSLTLPHCPGPRFGPVPFRFGENGDPITSFVQQCNRPKNYFRYKFICKDPWHASF
jgi:hypothetical protein